ncbi:MAG: PASTA domain-containing protein [Putridiphycobacter sp.]|nr:PASTA domain-containing protein [Putridiphycobacter sp.]
MKSVFSFIFSRKYLYHIIAILVVWAIVIFGTLWYLKSHTSFGEKIEVPSLYQIHADDIPALMASKGLAYEIIDSVYIDNWPKGTVCWQHPKPTDSTAEYVKNGRVIQLSIVPLKPKMIQVPNVLDKSKRMAESQLESVGLRTKISYKPSNVGPGFVMEQLIKGRPVKVNEMVPKGTLIELVVARGNGGEVVTLPNLVGLTISDAKIRLTNLNLALHPECPSCNSEADIERAIIKTQSPIGGEGANVASGTIITVWAEK